MNDKDNFLNGKDVSIKFKYYFDAKDCVSVYSEYRTGLLKKNDFIEFLRDIVKEEINKFLGEK